MEGFTPLPPPLSIFLPMTTPLVEISFSSKPSASIKIKDGGHTLEAAPRANLTHLLSSTTGNCTKHLMTGPKEVKPHRAVSFGVSR